ncbi:hypothetical protein AOLI_G00190910 [Acnodon oligacanthus]
MVASCCCGKLQWGKISNRKLFTFPAVSQARQSRCHLEWTQHPVEGWHIEWGRALAPGFALELQLGRMPSVTGRQKPAWPGGSETQGQEVNRSRCGGTFPGSRTVDRFQLAKSLFPQAAAQPAT